MARRHATRSKRKATKDENLFLVAQDSPVGLLLIIGGIFLLLFL